MKKVFITSIVRTPLGSFGGTLSKIGATDLGALVIKEAVEKSNIQFDDVNEVIMGQVLPCGYGQNPAKQAAIKAGMSDSCEALTINKVCGSALKSVMLGAQAIAVGDADIVVAGGMENMSSAPFFLEKARFGYRMGEGKIKDHMINDGLWDVVNNVHMGITNEYVSEKYEITREDQDRFAEQSYKRALNSIKKGTFKDEIVPVEVKTRKGVKIFDTDECPVDTDYETLSKMKAAFKKDGCGTAGNASIISDGAAAAVLMSEDAVKKFGAKTLVEIGAQASAGFGLKYILVSPILAIPKALKKEGLDIKDVDLFEVNEAFSGSTCAVMKDLSLDNDKVNVNGGSVALGHPIGASGCRVLATLVHEMVRRDSKSGVASLCLGGGEAVALVVKR